MSDFDDMLSQIHGDAVTRGTVHTHKVKVEVTPSAFGRLLGLMFGPAPSPILSLEEETWIGEGGALRPAEDGYTHVIVSDP